MTIRNIIAPALFAACGAAMISLAPLAQADATPPAAGPVVATFSAPAVHQDDPSQTCPNGGYYDPNIGGGQCEGGRPDHDVPPGAQGCPSGSSGPAEGDPAGSCGLPSGNPDGPHEEPFHRG